jgi:hypothetical protein
MKSVFRAASALCLVVCAIPAIAEPLTTDSVISLAKTGIGYDAVIAKIEAEDQRLIIFALGWSGAGGATAARIFDLSIR